MRLKSMYDCMKVTEFSMVPFVATNYSSLFHIRDDSCYAILGGYETHMNLIQIRRHPHYFSNNFSFVSEKRKEEFYTEITNKTLIVAADDYTPYVITSMENNKMVVTGYIGELWLILESVLNFRTVMKRAGFVDGRRMLTSGTADVLLQPTVVTGNNIDQVDFTRPVASSWYELYVRAPRSLESPGSYFNVWGMNLWIASLATLILLIASIRLLCQYGAFQEGSNDARKRQRLGDARQNSVSLGICLLSVLGSLGTEGFQLKPNSAAGRVLMITTLLFSLLLFNAYSAVLVASLAVTNPTLPFTDLEDVARKGTHALCVRNLSYAYMRLKEKEDNTEVAPRWRHVVNRKPCGEIVNKKDLKAAMCKWGVAVLETPSNMAVMSYSCQMKQIRGQYFAVPVSLEFRSRFPYTDLINSYIHRLQTSGVLNYLRTKWTAHSPMVSEDESVPNTTVTLRHVQLILALYATCIACSFLVLLIEIIW